MGRFKNKPCLNCSNLFEPRSSNDKWCKDCRTKSCEYCGNEFLVKNPSKVDSQKFCSKDCQIKGRFRDFKLKCHKCGAEFVSDSPSGKLCEKCKTYTCKTCGKTFIITKLRDEEIIKYCSRECLVKGRETRVKHTCKKCGKEFISSSGNSKWCETCCTVTCLICGKHIIVKPRRVKLTKYCSKECRAKGDMNHIWTEQDFDFIKENYPYKMSMFEIAQKFDTSISAIARLKSKLNLEDCPIELRQRRVGDAQMLWTIERIIDKVREMHKLGESISSSHVQQKYGSLHTAAYNRFGNWKNTVEAAGFDYNDVNMYSERITWTTEMIINKIKRLYKANEDLMASSVRDNHTALFIAARRDNELGSWEKAIEAAGLDYQDICGERWGQIYIGKDGKKYTSIIEGKVGDYLFEFLEQEKIVDYFTQVRVTPDRRWTCDFVVSLAIPDNSVLWVEVDGLEESRREGAYKEDNEKINYYINNNFNYRIIVSPNEIKDIIEKETNAQQPI